MWIKMTVYTFGLLAMLIPQISFAQGDLVSARVAEVSPLNVTEHGISGKYYWFQVKTQRPISKCDNSRNFILAAGATVAGEADEIIPRAFYTLVLLAFDSGAHLSFFVGEKVDVEALAEKGFHGIPNDACRMNLKYIRK